MVRKKRRSEDDAFGPSKGWVKWLGKFFRLLLYPFIKPVYFFSTLIVVVVVLVAIPSYHGVKASDFLNWYKQVFARYYQKSEKAVKNVFVKDEKVNAFKNLSLKHDNDWNLKKDSDKNDMVDYTSPETYNRKIFEKAADVTVDVNATINNAVNKKNLYRFRRNDTIGLNYLVDPQDVKGMVTVINANELVVGDVELFLYGIYVDPASEKGELAKRYLLEEVDGKEVECKIVAYSQDNIPTAICVIGDKSINQLLVDLEYSADVTLN